MEGVVVRDMHYPIRKKSFKEYMSSNCFCVFLELGCLGPWNTKKIQIQFSPVPNMHKVYKIYKIYTKY